METALYIRLAISPCNFATSLDLQDEYFHVSIYPTIMEVPPICMGKPNFRVRVSPIRVVYRSVHFHKSLKAGGSASPTAGHETENVPG